MGESETKLERCCCGCCSLRTGTKIIAILDLIGSTLTIVRNTIMASIMVNDPQIIDNRSYPGFNKNPNVYITLAIIGIVMGFIYATLSGLLLSGARTMDWRKCLPWLYWNYFVLGLIFVLAMTFVAFALFNGNTRIIWIFAGSCSIMFGIAYYFVNVVQRFVKEIKANDDRQSVSEYSDQFT